MKVASYFSPSFLTSRILQFSKSRAFMVYFPYIPLFVTCLNTFCLLRVCGIYRPRVCTSVLFINHPPESGLAVRIYSARAFQRKRLVTKNAINGGMFIAHFKDRKKTAHRKKSQCRGYTSCLAVYTVAL